MDPQAPITNTPTPVEEPVIPPTVQPSNRINNVTILSMAIFVLLSLGAVAFLYYQNQQLKSMLANYQTPAVSPTPVATTDPTANWKTYKLSSDLSKKNYEIKYPEGWSVGTGTREVGDGFTVLKSGNEYAITFTFSPDDSQGTVCIFPDDPTPNPKIISTQKCSGEYREIKGQQSIFRRQNLDTKISTTWLAYLKNEQGNFTDLPIIDYAIPKTPDISVVATMDQILSTFKFTDPGLNPEPVPSSTPISY